MNIKNTLILWLAALGLAACTTDPILVHVPEEGKDAVVRINYGSNVDDVLATRAGLTDEQESAIYSIYVMTFNQNGNRTNSDEDALFYRTDTGLGTTKTWVDQSEASNYSKGYIQFNAKTGANTIVYAVANVNTAEHSGIYSLSKEELDEVTTLDQFQALTIRLNNQAISRGQRLLMLGCLKDSETSVEPKKVTIGGNNQPQILEGSLFFERMDAKVIFNVDVDPEVSGVEFDLHSWQVFNVPMNAHLFKGTGLGQGLTNEQGLQTFNINPSVQFDNGNSFTFYLLESNLSPKQELTEYAQREAKNKTEAGAYELTDGSWTWKYAPESAPYVQIKGRLSQTTSSNDLIHADVVYNVHLGNFSSAPNNFWTRPNTRYTYNIYVAGVNNIRTEVETSNDIGEGVTENQPGAEGNVVIASGKSVYEIDAHYAQMLLPFTYNHTSIDDFVGNNSIDALTWYVSTPYAEGAYDEGKNDAGTKHYDDELLDYKWVEFYINHENQMVTYTQYLEWLHENGRATRNSDGSYTKTQPLYVKELVEELKTWYKYKTEVSDVKPNLITVDNSVQQSIYVTAFVNEFYYEQGNPMTGDNDIAAMVREVVNADDRYMHILSNVQHSMDGASSVTNSAATIIQKPIRSIYNIPQFGLLSGYNLIWGTETVSEQYGQERTDYGPNSKGLLYGTINNTSASSNTNGRLNTYYMWNGLEWNDKMGVSNNVWTLNNPNTYSGNPAVYNCLARNRDENGDGKINPAEMKWYMAAIDQLQYLYIGENVIHPDAKLLPSNINLADKNGGAKYCHYLSSTYKSGQGGWILWAEEGLSTSGNTPGWDSGYIEGDKKLDYVLRYTRCLRNLGADGNEPSTIGQGMNDLIKQTGNTITPTYLNKDALRQEKWTAATIFHDDVSSLNTPYIGGFEMDSQTRDWGNFGGWGDNTSLVNKIHNGDNCPEGYRIPNQRELALMYLSGVRVNGGVYMWSATYNKYKSVSSWPHIAGITSQGFTTAIGTDMNKSTVRCIRDVDSMETGL